MPRAEGGAATPGAARSVIVAFIRICGFPEQDTVARQAGSYGFTPVPRDPTSSHGYTFYAPGVPGAPFGLVAWHAEARRCVLLVGAPAASAVEQAFASQIDAFERAPGIRVERLSTNEIAEFNQQSRTGFLLRQGAVIGGNAWALYLRQEADPSVFGRLNIQMTRAPAAPGAPPPPPVSDAGRAALGAPRS